MLGITDLLPVSYINKVIQVVPTMFTEYKIEMLKFYKFKYIEYN